MYDLYLSLQNQDLIAKVSFGRTGITGLRLRRRNSRKNRSSTWRVVLDSNGALSALSNSTSFTEEDRFSTRSRYIRADLGLQRDAGAAESYVTVDPKSDATLVGITVLFAAFGLLPAGMWHAQVRSGLLLSSLLAGRLST